MHHGAANPRADGLLATRQYFLHCACNTWSLLNPVQPLPSVAQAVARPLEQHVRLGQAPQLKHVCGDFPPQGEGLQHVVVLPLMGVGEAGAFPPTMDSQAETIFEGLRGEVSFKERNHVVYRVSIEQQVAVVVSNRVHTRQKQVRRPLPARVLPSQLFPRFFLALNIPLDLPAGPPRRLNLCGSYL